MLHSEMKSSPEGWQELICRIEGVYAARVVFGEPDQPKEIHVLAADSKSPKALTRDIQSAIMAVYGVPLDYRIISIAQVASNIVETDTRLRFAGIETRVIDGQGEVSVYLARGDERREGKASYTGKHIFSRFRSVAMATMDAISLHIGNDFSDRFELLTAETAEIGGKTAAIVCICDEQGRQLLGNAFVTEDSDNAVVRAVLDALNRHLARMPA